MRTQIRLSTLVLATQMTPQWWRTRLGERATWMVPATADGWLQQWLTQAWIALIFARWEDYYRPGFAALHGVETRAITSDVIGDIRHMRNDVIHHGSVATAENTGTCKVLTRFETGEQIMFTPEDVRLMKFALQVAIES